MEALADDHIPGLRESMSCLCGHEQPPPSLTHQRKQRWRTLEGAGSKLAIEHVRETHMLHRPQEPWQTTRDNMTGICLYGLSARGLRRLHEEVDVKHEVVVAIWKRDD